MRQVLHAGCGMVLIVLANMSSARAQDTIRYIDRKTMKEANAIGTIQDENPSTVTYKGAGAGTREIAALDIRDIQYDVPGEPRLIFRSAAGDELKASNPATKDTERQKALDDALKGYQEGLAKLPKEKFKFAERHIQFKIARLQARIAEETPEQTDAAIGALASFVKKYADGWQISQAARLLARLQLNKGDPDGAVKTYERLAATADIPKQVKQDCDLLIAEALISGKKYADAQKRLQSLLAGLSADDPQAFRVKVYLAECLGASGKLQDSVTQLEGLIAKTTDKNLLGLAYNALGDCYRLNNRNKEALWPYLWVDVIYHQDKQEHIKAMEQLAKLFEEQGDKTRAKQYRERLKRETK